MILNVVLAFLIRFSSSWLNVSLIEFTLLLTYRPQSAVDAPDQKSGRLHDCLGRDLENVFLDPFEKIFSEFASGDRPAEFLILARGAGYQVAQR